MEEVKAKAQVARLAAIMAGDEKAWAEEELARVLNSLAIAQEARRKAEAKAARLEVERTSLMKDIGVAKDEVSSLKSQEEKDKEAMEEDYQKALELIGYGCCAFKHNICGDQPKVLDGMPDSSDPLPLKFFVNPRCLPTPIATEATTTEAEQRETTEKAKDQERSAYAKDFAESP